jgi:hypothetical protein
MQTPLDCVSFDHQEINYGHRAFEKYSMYNFGIKTPKNKLYSRKTLHVRTSHAENLTL